MADDVQSWFKDLPYKLRRELAGQMKEIADQLADDIRSAAPEGETGLLRDSVRVRRGKNSLAFIVEAGGALTTKEIREGSGIPYDYALALEFGTSRMAAQPFFYNTFRAEQDTIRQQIEDAVNGVLQKA